MIPHRTPAILPFFFPTLTWRIATNEKELFLTFDDGPIPGPTEFVLDILKQRKVGATFFCIGDNVRKHPEIFKQILAEGHAIGNHTFNHLSGWKTARRKYMENIRLCESEILKSINLPDKNSRYLFRPPYGRIPIGIKKNLPEYRIVMWDVLTHDYDREMPPETCLNKSIEATRNGSIIVFHDSLKAEKNMTYVLPRYIDHFLERGYKFKSLEP
jgi:peptidoglycan/xylan/chitin deacetylase (PgdA/CDA1 family)